MHLPQKLRFYGVPIVDSIVIFFCFLGHLVCSIREVIARETSISWLNVFKVIYNSGVKLLIPIILISVLLADTLVLSINNTLGPFNLQRKGFILAHNIFFYDALPFYINLILSIQVALNLVNNGRMRLQKNAHQTILIEIIPLLIGVNLCAIALYMYALSAVYLSTFLFFRYFLKADVHEFMLQLSTTITSYSVLYSMIKTFLFCTMISTIACYYNYQVTVSYLPLRKAVSRIMTRSFIVLAVGSVYFKFLEY